MTFRTAVALPCLLLLLRTASGKTVCSKGDIDARRTEDQGFGLTIDARSWVECDEVDLSITSSWNSGDKLLEDGTEELARYLKVSLRVTRLKVVGNFIGDAGVAHLAEALRHNTVLESLWLGRNNISDTGLSTLMEALQENQKLRELKLEFNTFSSADAIARTLDPAVCVSGLRNLDLSGNQLDDDAVGVLMSVVPLTNQFVEELILSFNHITDAGVIAAAAIIAQDPPSLSKLWFDGNDITATGADALSEALTTNSHLEKLSLARTEGYDSDGGDAVRVQLSLPDFSRVNGTGDFDCHMHTAQPFEEYPRSDPSTADTLEECQQACRQLQRPGCAGVEWSSETHECWVAPFASGARQVNTQLVAMPRHYLCDNIRTDYAALTREDL